MYVLGLTWEGYFISTWKFWLLLAVVASVVTVMWRAWSRYLQRRASILTFRFYFQTAMAEHQLASPMLAIFQPSL